MAISPSLIIKIERLIMKISQILPGWVFKTSNIYRDTKFLKLNSFLQAVELDTFNIVCFSKDLDVISIKEMNTNYD